MYFLRKEKTDPSVDPSAFLMNAGTQIKDDEIPTIENIQRKNTKELLALAFDHSPNWKEELQKRIDGWLSAH